MKTFTLTVKQIIDETKDAYTIVFDKPADEAFNYKAGQYLTLKTEIQGEKLRRAFSLSSSPVTDNTLAVTIKRVAGGKVSNYLRDTLKPGQEIAVLPPLGNFKIDHNPANANHYVLIGAGSGITPLMSMLKTVLKAEPSSRVTLWYGNNNEDSIIFHNELSQMVSSYNGKLSVVHFLSQSSPGWQGEKGRLDKANITRLLRDLFMKDEYKKLYYVCGPEEMMKAALEVLENEGVYKENVFREYYAAPAPTDEEAEKVHGEKPAKAMNQATIILDGQTFTVDIEGDEYVLDSAINAGVDPPYSCQAGVCTTCRALLKKGKVEMDTYDGLTDYEIDQGYILTCQSRCVEGPLELEYK
ncbi:MAG: ferredoxin--NADP reductase [Bacteroidia bacterium]|nr:ferredoxin--NADP reductase [Bacteroidia bacterium]